MAAAIPIVPASKTRAVSPCPGLARRAAWVATVKGSMRPAAFVLILSLTR